MRGLRFQAVIRHFRANAIDLIGQLCYHAHELSNRGLSLAIGDGNQLPC